MSADEKPPSPGRKSTQFKPGKSGNPRGRPKKADQLAKIIGGHPSSIDRPVREMLLAEAFRTVTISDNGKAVKMPAAQAMFRSGFIQGIKGNQHVLRDMTAQLRQAELDAAGEERAKAILGPRWYPPKLNPEEDDAV